MSVAGDVKKFFFQIMFLFLIFERVKYTLCCTIHSNPASRLNCGPRVALVMDPVAMVIVLVVTDQQMDKTKTSLQWK